MTYILPIISYCNPCLILNISQNLLIEKIQKKISKIICFKAKKIGLKYKERLEFLNIPSLECRRKLSVLKIVFKCMNNFDDMPQHWKETFVKSDNTRNGLKLIKPQTRNKFCDKIFLYILQNYSILYP